MTRVALLLIVAAALCGLAPAQQNNAKTPAVVRPPAAAPVIVESIIYPFPPEEHSKIRDLEHENDQIEIENQKMLLKIEQNKARQSVLVDAVRSAAFQFAQAKRIDLDQYELDLGQIRFVKKKAAIK